MGGSQLNIASVLIRSESETCSVVSDSLWPHGLYSPWNSPGHNTGMGSLSLLQGIFPTQGSNPGLPHCKKILYQLSHQGSPRILEWVAYPLSRGSSWPRNWTGVSHIAGRFFTNWALREACPHKKRWGQTCTEGRPREDMARRWPSACQGGRPPEKPTLPAHTLTSHFQAPEWWES